MTRYLVLYAKQPTFLDSAGPPTVRRLIHTHVLVREMEAPDVETVYCEMQAERWSRDGEAAELIARLGLTHTSMSVGDAAWDGSAYHECTMDGWRAFAPSSRSVYDLLLKDARDWRRHHRLQDCDDTLPELLQVQDGLELLQEAVYANVAALGGSWTVHRRVRYENDGAYVIGAREGCGGLDEPTIQCCILAGIPMLDFSVEGCNVRRILAIPPEKRPAEVAPWYGGTLQEFIGECVAAGARLVAVEEVAG